MLIKMRVPDQRLFVIVSKSGKIMMRFAYKKKASSSRVQIQACDEFRNLHKSAHGTHCAPNRHERLHILQSVLPRCSLEGWVARENILTSWRRRAQFDDRMEIVKRARECKRRLRGEHLFATLSATAFHTQSILQKLCAAFQCGDDAIFAIRTRCICKCSISEHGIFARCCHVGQRQDTSVDSHRLEFALRGIQFGLDRLFQFIQRIFLDRDGKHECLVPIAARVDRQVGMVALDDIAWEKNGCMPPFKIINCKRLRKIHRQVQKLVHLFFRSCIKLGFSHRNRLAFCRNITLLRDRHVDF